MQEECEQPALLLPARPNSNQPTLAPASLVRNPESSRPSLVRWIARLKSHPVFSLSSAMAKTFKLHHVSRSNADPHHALWMPGQNREIVTHSDHGFLRLLLGRSSLCRLGNSLSAADGGSSLGCAIPDGAACHGHQRDRHKYSPTVVGAGRPHAQLGWNRL